jgi:predicted  nucleic acid-binding Zn-ribbon protein
MGRPRTVNCTRCGHAPPSGVTLSARKRCPNCGETAQIDNLRQLVAHKGPYFDHWRERLAASVGATLDGRGPRA